MSTTATQPMTFTIIPPDPQYLDKDIRKKHLRVAPYCWVSTDTEEQLSSYEAQIEYYTAKIDANPDWSMVRLYADEGITGTSAEKRPEFLKMIRKCRQQKIDIVLVKSISRFARNTVDCLKYIRALKELGIAVIFEKENINTMETDSEMLITMMGAFAQAESESISANVRWGKRQAMREGHAILQYKYLYAYEKGEDGMPRIIPEQAEVYRWICNSFLAGHSLRMIKDTLEREGHIAPNGGTVWSIASIRNLLKSEKYCGDVLMQKSYIKDCISGKVQRNTGELPMYLIQDHHEGIISRETFHAIQAEFSRCNAGRAPSKKLAPTGRSCYSAKYALTERLVCGDCGTLYRRCVWSKRGKKSVVWRCSSRIDYGTKYCKESPTIYEKPLQRAILAVVNSIMSQKIVLIDQIADAMRMELLPLPRGTMSMAEIDKSLTELEQEFQSVFQLSRKEEGGYMKYASTFKRINDEAADLKDKRKYLLEQQQSDSAADKRIQDAVNILNTGTANITEWDESLIRQLVDMVKVISEDKILVRLKDGLEVEQTLDDERD